MALFSWLFGKSSQVTLADSVWLTRAAKNAGVVADLQRRGPEVQLVMLLAHFPETLAAMQEELVGAGLELTFLSDRVKASDVLAAADDPKPAVLVGLERQLREARQLPAETESPGVIKIVVPERHLLRDYDDGIVAFVNVLGRKSEVRFHSSLDDPLMKMFAGDWVANTLRRLGMSDSDPIESTLVQSRIKAAQKKLAQGVTNAQDADSPEEWLRVNGAG